MLVGYVSDERYMALSDVALVFEGSFGRVATRSQADGAVVANVVPAPYRVTLAKDGFGAKRVDVTLTPGRPYHFRLLSDRLRGYVWPKWITAGAEGEFRVQSTAAYKLSVWRYGWTKELVRDLGTVVVLRTGSLTARTGYSTGPAFARATCSGSAA